MLLTGDSRPHGPSFVRLHIDVPDRRRRDPANLTPVTKAVVDGLVDAGVWPDDTPDWITTIEPRLTPTDQRPMHTRVEIVPRPSPEVFP
jgi:hypothetical protein